MGGKKEQVSLVVDLTLAESFLNLVFNILLVPNAFHRTIRK